MNAHLVPGRHAGRRHRGSRGGGAHSGAGAGPVETYSVTRVSAATLLPWAGSELITRPLWTVLLAWPITVERRFAVTIFFCAVATGWRFTSGTWEVWPSSETGAR